MAGPWWWQSAVPSPAEGDAAGAEDSSGRGKKEGETRKRGASAIVPPISSENGENGTHEPSLPSRPSRPVEETKKKKSLDILVEIVSCWDLPVGDIIAKTSDPYVKVNLGDECVHKTGYVPKTLDPVFTVEQESMFVLTLSSAEELRTKNGLLLKVKDYDAVGRNDELGIARVPADRILPSLAADEKAEEANGQEDKGGDNKDDDRGGEGSGGGAGGGDRMEFPLKGKGGKSAGHIAIRCREATDYDVQFLDGVKNKKDDMSSFLGVRSSIQKRIKRKVVTRDNVKKFKGSSSGSGVLSDRGSVMSNRDLNASPTEVTKYRVRPHPDPQREEETEWMTREEIDAECTKKSREWLDMGSGGLGKVYVEILGADGLPDYDTGGIFGSSEKNKTDAFVSIVYEDVMAKTDVIDDCLSPRWLPWTRRAFVFRTMNVASNLLVGVFDRDRGINDSDDFIGRVSIDLANLRPRTEYVLRYKLRESPNRAEEKSVLEPASEKRMGGGKTGADDGGFAAPPPPPPLGTITIRLRIEMHDERAALLSSLQKLPPNVYVNVRDKEDFRVVRMTCFGKYDEDLYDNDTISARIEELRSYKYMVHYLKDALVGLIFWRGHFPLSFRVIGRGPIESNPEKNKGEKEETQGGFLDKFTRVITIHLPVHSFNMFVAAIMLAEHPSLLPSFFFLGIGSSLLAVDGYRRHGPNPWRRTRSFTEFIEILVFGERLTRPRAIARNENEKEARAFEEKWERRIGEAEKKARRLHEGELKELKEHEELLQEIGDVPEFQTDLSTKTTGGSGIIPSLDLLKPILFPIQKHLGTACDAVRFVRNVICWEEPYYSFWLTAFSLALGIVFFFVPWAFLFKWTSRVVAWTLFGPWMKLVDIFWYRKRNEPTEEELEKRREEERKAEIEVAKAKAAAARAKREEAAKLKAIKTVLYGQYFTKVPILELNRNVDVPLYDSTAEPRKDSVSPSEAQSKRVAGQRLMGNMVPKLKSCISDTLTKLDEEEQHTGRSSRKPVFIAVALLVVAGVRLYGTPTSFELSNWEHLVGRHLPHWRWGSTSEMGGRVQLNESSAGADHADAWRSIRYVHNNGTAGGDDTNELVQPSRPPQKKKRAQTMGDEQTETSGSEQKSGSPHQQRVSLKKEKEKKKKKKMGFFGIKAKLGWLKKKSDRKIREG